MIDDEVRALRESAGVLMRDDRAVFEVRGPDRVRYLNGMVSNDVSSLAPGRVLMAVKATSRGKVEAIVRIRAREDSLELDLARVVAPRAKRSLEQLLVMDDCTITDVSEDRDVIALFGPHAPRVLAAMGVLAPSGDLEFTVCAGAAVTRDDGLGVHGYELHVPRGEGPRTLDALREAGAEIVTPESLDVLRIEAGVPLEGLDIDDETIPMEARLDHAISFTKGCYVGQEVIARATHHGAIKHILVGLRFDGEELPRSGSKIFVEDGSRETGTLTSVVRSSTLGAVIGLGYVRRTDETPGTRVVVQTADGGDARFDARVVTLPFVPNVVRTPPSSAAAAPPG